eukprot:343295-Chlamydomonas_euryale.AAC.1
MPAPLPPCRSKKSHTAASSNGIRKSSTCSRDTGPWAPPPPPCAAMPPPPPCAAMLSTSLSAAMPPTPSCAAVPPPPPPTCDAPFSPDSSRELPRRCTRTHDAQRCNRQ